MASRTHLNGLVPMPAETRPVRGWRPMEVVTCEAPDEYVPTRWVRRPAALLMWPNALTTAGLYGAERARSKSRLGTNGTDHRRRMESHSCALSRSFCMVLSSILRAAIFHACIPSCLLNGSPMNRIALRPATSGYWTRRVCPAR